jgi:tetratricopeptide (TPR) repeat protein
LDVIDRAPSYMAAKVAYAECISAMVSSGYHLEKYAVCGALNLLKEVAKHAPDTAGLHSQHGHLLDCLWNFSDARAFHQRALNTSPDDSASHHNFGWHLLATNAPQQAIAAFEQARTLAPFFLPSTIMLARACMMTGDLEQTRRWAEQAVEEHPESSHAQLYLLTLRAYLSPSADLLPLAREVPLGDFSWSFAASSVAYVLARCGARDEALQVVDRWSSSANASLNVSHVTPLLVLGDIERAMGLMETAQKAGFGALPIFMRVHENAEVRNHPRFAALYEQVFGRI